MKMTRRCCFAFCVLVLSLVMTAVGLAQSQSTTELKDAAGKAPAAADMQKGDPAGTITGTISDVPVSDSKAGLTLGDAANQIGQNKIAINFTWTLITGFLVMFMQAGFAMVEAGLCRVKNANHTYMMNFSVYALWFACLLADRFCHTDGRCGRKRESWRPCATRFRASALVVRQHVGILRRLGNVSGRPHL